MADEPEARAVGAMGQAAGQIAGGIMAGARGIAGAVADTSRPLGVTLFAGWTAFLGGLYMILLLVSLCGLNLLSQILQPPPAPAPAPTQPGFPPGYPPPATNPFTSMFQLNTGAILLFLLFIAFLAFAHLGLARGLYQLKRWAFWSVAGLEAFNILVGLIDVLAISHNGVKFVTGIFLSVLTLVYMFSVPSVRRAFQVGF